MVVRRHLDDRPAPTVITFGYPATYREVRQDEINNREIVITVGETEKPVPGLPCGLFELVFQPYAADE